MADDPSEFDKSAFVADLKGDLVPTESETPLRGTALLVGESPTEILDRISERDPLEIRRRTAEFMRSECYLLDHERVAQMTIQYVAFTAARDRYRGDPPLALFINECMTEAVKTLLEEDWGAEQRNEPIDPEDDLFIDVPFGEDVDPQETRRILLEFNQRHARMRKPLFWVLVRGMSFDEVADHFGLSDSELRGFVRRTLSRMPKTEPTYDGIDMANLLGGILGGYRERRDADKGIVPGSTGEVAGALGAAHVDSEQTSSAGDEAGASKASCEPFEIDLEALLAEDELLQNELRLMDNIPMAEEAPILLFPTASQRNAQRSSSSSQANTDAGKSESQGVENQDLESGEVQNSASETRKTKYFGRAHPPSNAPQADGEEPEPSVKDAKSPGKSVNQEPENTVQNGAPQPSSGKPKASSSSQAPDAPQEPHAPNPSDNPKGGPQ